MAASFRAFALIGAARVSKRSFRYVGETPEAVYLAGGLIEIVASVRASAPIRAARVSKRSLDIALSKRRVSDNG